MTTGERNTCDHRIEEQRGRRGRHMTTRVRNTGEVVGTCDHRIEEQRGRRGRHVTTRERNTGKG